MPAVSPASLYDVVVEVFTCANVVHPLPWQRSIKYAVTPTLSVDAVHVRLIWLVETAVPLSPEGAVGACVSGAACVVALAVFEYVLRFPAASAARTR